MLVCFSVNLWDFYCSSFCFWNEICNNNHNRVIQSYPVFLQSHVYGVSNLYSIRESVKKMILFWTVKSVLHTLQFEKLSQSFVHTTIWTVKSVLYTLQHPLLLKGWIILLHRRQAAYPSLPCNTLHEEINQNA